VSAQLKLSGWFASVIVSLVLVACGDREHDDVRAWMQEASKDLRGHIPELPQIKPLEVKPYEPGDLLSPFAVDKVVSGGLGSGVLVARAGGPPPINPDAYPLTKVPLESIRFIGTIVVDKEARALVQIEREPIRQVRVGDYLGQSNGRVLKVVPSGDESTGQIVLREKLLDKGAWVERETMFPGQDKGDRK
jgi:type IV pilus assembly protein PilP